MVKFDFLCPNGTIFNQEEFVCDWWFNVDCTQADTFYFLNIEVAEKNAERQAQREAEREKEEQRERKELTADEINDLREGIRPEEDRSSKKFSKPTSRPFGRLTLNKSQAGQIFRPPQNKRISKKKQFEFSKKSTTTTKRPRRGFSGFSTTARSQTRSSKSPSTTTKKPRRGFTSRGQNGRSKKQKLVLKSSVNNHNQSSSTSSRRKPKTSNSNSGSDTKPTGFGSRRKKLKGRKQLNKSNAFSAFGNGQSRFGNF